MPFPQKAPDLIDPVVGFRQWRLVQGRLCSPFSGLSWDDPVLDAVCPLGTHNSEEVPAEGCSCGIYALYDPCPRTASTATADLVSGAVVLWGTIQLHTNGLRAGSCRIIALELPLSRGRKRSACLAAAEALGVPAVPHRRLRAQAAEHGAPLPSAMRPPRQRMRPVDGRPGGPFPVVPAGVRRALTATRSGIVGAASPGQTVPGLSPAPVASTPLSTPGGALVRSARRDDAPEVSVLLAELGYPEAHEGTAERLAAMVAGPDTDVLVCEVKGRVAAVAAYQVITLLEHSQPQCRVTALVVARQNRRQRLGTALLMAIEKVALERGCCRLEVTTRPDRSAALELYLAAGFEERPRRLVKALPHPGRS